MDQQKVFELIEMYRKQAGIPKMDFYKKVGITHVGYIQMRAAGSIKLTTLCKIAEVLFVPLSAFIPYNDNEASYLLDVRQRFLDYKKKVRDIIQQLSLIEQEEL